MTTDQARKILKDAGFYTDNLWHVSDVQKEHPNKTREEAYNILHEILNSPTIVQDINETISLL